MPWWAVALIALAALTLGAVVAWAATLLYIGRGMWR